MWNDARRKSVLERVSYHVVYDTSIIDALHYAQANGFAGVQVAIELPHFSPENVGKAERAQIATYCAENALSITLHAPDNSTSLFAASPPLVEGIFTYFRAMFDFAEQIGSQLITFHVGTPPSFGTAPRPGQRLPEVDEAVFQAVMKDNLTRLIDLANGQFILCIENIGLTGPVRQVLQPYLDAGKLALCWDLPKSCGNQEIESWLWANVDHVRQVHLHDVSDGYSHQVIGTGKLDLMQYLPPLAKANVLDWCIEVRPREKALESLANLNRMLAG